MSPIIPEGTTTSGPEQVGAALLRLGKLQPNDIVVDAGCGTGRAGVALRTGGWDGSLVGLDLNSGKLNIAAATGAYDQLMKCSLYEVPMPDNSVAAVISGGVFTHGHVRAEALHELHRVVRPDGLLSITLREDLIPQHERWCEIGRSRLDPSLTGVAAKPQLVVTWRIGD